MTAAYANRGAIEADFARMSKTAEETFKRLGAAWDRAVGRMGESLAPTASAIADSLNQIMSAIDRGETIWQKLERVDKARRQAGGEAPTSSDPCCSTSSSEYWRNKLWGGRTALDHLFPGEQEISAAERAAREAGHRDRAGVSGLANSEIARSLVYFARSPRFGRLSQRAHDALRDEAERNANSIASQFDAIRAGREYRPLPDRNPWADPARMGPVEVRGEAKVSSDVNLKVELTPNSMFDAYLDRKIEQKVARMPIRSTSGPGSAGQASDAPTGSSIKAGPR